MVEPQFDELDGLERGIAWSRRGERWCAIDRRGRTVPSAAEIVRQVPFPDLRGPESEGLIATLAEFEN